MLRALQPGNISGTLLCVPVVNAYGFIGRSRYLPDRRDLNRSFPGSPNGSLAARLANLFLNEVVKRCQFGIDLHTAAVHRVNLPQIRADFVKRPRCRELSEAFGVQVVLESPERAGSLRRAARDVGVDVLVYEGGEGLRFDEFAIKAGVDGIANVMLKSGMLELPDGVEIPHQKDSERRPVLCQRLQVGTRARRRHLPHAAQDRPGGRRRRDHRLGRQSLRRHADARSAPRAAASSSATPRSPSSTWATRCFTSPGPTSSSAPNATPAPSPPATR